MSKFCSYITNEEMYDHLWKFLPEVFRMMINATSLEESLNWNKAEVRIIKHTAFELLAKFDYETLHYNFSAHKIKDTDIWVLMYDLIGQTDPDRTAFQRLKTDKIHNGVFAAAIRCIDEFLKIVKPKIFSFGTNDKRLAILYKRIVPTILKQFPSLEQTLVPNTKYNNEENYNWQFKVKE